MNFLLSTRTSTPTPTPTPTSIATAAVDSVGVGDVDAVEDDVVVDAVEDDVVVDVVVVVDTDIVDVGVAEIATFIFIFMFTVALK